MTFVRVIFSFLLAGALEVSAQEPILNVGTNFEKHISEFDIYILQDGRPIDGAYVLHRYDQSEGSLRDVTERMLRELTAAFVPPVGMETALFSIRFQARTAPMLPLYDWSGPQVAASEYGDTLFRLVQDATGQWRIPETVIRQTIDGIGYGWIIYNWPWVTKVVIELENKEFGFKETLLSGNGVDPNLQCYIADNKLLYLRPYLVVPELQRKSFEDSTTMTLTAYDTYGRWTKVNLRNGFELARSDSPPYRALPKVLQIVRHIGTTELTLEGETGAELIVEFRETLGNAEWENIAYPYVLLTSGKRNFSHKTSSDTGFYRVRENILPPLKR